MTAKKELSHATKRAAAEAFIDAVVKAAEQYEIPTEIVFSLLGKLAKATVGAAIDKGADPEKTMFSIINGFMKGLGVEVQELPEQAKTAGGRLPPTTH